MVPAPARRVRHRSASAVTSTSTVMPRWSDGNPVQVPEIGIA